MSGFDPIFDPAGTGSRAGPVPAPGAIDGRTFYMRADGSWAVPVGNAPGPEPPTDPTALNQWACNIAGYLTYEVCRIAVKLAVDWVPVSWIGDIVGGITAGVVRLVLAEDPIVAAIISDMVFHFVQDHIVGLATGALTNLLDDVLWAKVHCALYSAIAAAPTDFAAALTAAAGVIGAFAGYTAAATAAIAYFLQHLGITSVANIPLSAFIQNYDCSTCAITGIGPTKPLLQSAFDLTVTDSTNTGTFIDTMAFAHATVSVSGTKATVTIPQLEVTDGTHDLTGVTKVTVTGATVGGTTPNATLTVPPQLELTDGTHDLTGVAKVTVSGLVVGGTTPNATLTASPQLEVTDGTHDLAGVSKLTVTGATVGGTTPNATLTVPGLELTDGTHDLTGVSKITVLDMTVGGVAAAATLASNARAKAGKVSVAIASAAAAGSAAVVFPSPYTTAPAVVVSVAHGSDGVFAVEYASVSTTGFTAWLTAPVPVTANIAREVSWAAFGVTSNPPGGLFNGVDAFVSLASDLAFGTGDFSIGGWFQTVQSSTGWLVQVGYAGGNPGVFVGIQSGHLVSEVRDSTGVDHFFTSTPTITDDNPHHWVLTRHSNTAVLYLDGAVAVSGAADSGSVNAGGAVTRFGTQLGTSQFFQGIMWGVRAYTGTQITGAQVAAWFAGTPPAGATNAWGFLDGTGTTVADSIASDTGTWHGTGPFWS